MVAGRIAHRQRTKSTWNVIQGLGDNDGLMGQYGRDLAMINAVQAMAAACSIWQPHSAIRGGRVPRFNSDPPVLPIPNPARKTARIMENA